MIEALTWRCSRDLLLSGFVSCRLRDGGRMTALTPQRIGGYDPDAPRSLDRLYPYSIDARAHEKQSRADQHGKVICPGGCAARRVL